jgi:hypothetical protein
LVQGLGWKGESRAAQVRTKEYSEDDRELTVGFSIVVPTEDLNKLRLSLDDLFPSRRVKGLVGSI